MAEPSLKPMTVTQFLQWEETQPEAPRFELIDGVPHMMSPERTGHVRVKGAVFAAFGRAINKARIPCEVFVEGHTVPISASNGYKPDVHITCDIPDDQITISNHPVIVIEVLSPSTSSFDKGSKLIGYFSLESVAHYLLVDPTRQSVEHHQRTDSQIVKTSLKEGVLELDPPGLAVDIADFFSLRW